jgi:hypothetical protein
MKKACLGLFVIALLAGAGGGGWWYATRLPRALAQAGAAFTKGGGPVSDDEPAIELVLAHAGDPRVTDLFVRVVEADQYGPDDRLVTAVKTAFDAHPPEMTDELRRAIVLCHVRQYDKAPTPCGPAWLPGWDRDPKVSALLEEVLGEIRKDRGQWPTAASAVIARTLAARPPVQTVEQALALCAGYGIDGEAVFVDLAKRLDRSVLDQALTRAAADPDERVRDDARALACELGLGQPDDVASVLRVAARSAEDYLTRFNAYDSTKRAPDDDGRCLSVVEGGPAAQWQAFTYVSNLLEGPRRALVALGPKATPALVELLETSPSRWRWTLAARALAEGDPPAFFAWVERQFLTFGRAAEADDAASERVARALVAVSHLPPGDPRADGCCLRAFSSVEGKVRLFALAGIEERIPAERRCDAVFDYLARREEFDVPEVQCYQDMLVKIGEDLPAHVVATLERLLAAAQGDPEQVRWIQKVLALRLLAKVGDRRALPILAKYRADTGGYQWITETTVEGKPPERTTQEIPFAQAVAETVAAIEERCPSPEAPTPAH